MAQGAFALPEVDEPPQRSGEAADIARGVCRAFGDLGFRALTEMRLASGRRADVVGLDHKGRFVIAEVKTSVADYRADHKWPEYLAFCDGFFFAVPAGFPHRILPDSTGVIVADRYGGELLRPPPASTMAAPRRRRQTLLFALTASGRLYREHQARYDG